MHLSVLLSLMKQKENKEKEIKITKESNIDEVVTKYPETVEVLLDHGLSCVGCPMSRMESIEEGALGHGMSEDDINNLIERLNEVVIFKE